MGVGGLLLRFAWPAAALAYKGLARASNTSPSRVAWVGWRHTGCERACAPPSTLLRRLLRVVLPVKRDVLHPDDSDLACPRASPRCVPLAGSWRGARLRVLSARATSAGSTTVASGCLCLAVWGCALLVVECRPLLCMLCPIPAPDGSPAPPRYPRLPRDVTWLCGGRRKVVRTMGTQPSRCLGVVHGKKLIEKYPSIKSHIDI